MTLAPKAQGFLVPDHVFFWTMVGAAVAATTALLVGLRKVRARRRVLATEPPMARQATTVIVLGSLAMTVMLLHWFSWGSFKRVDVHEDKLVLHYYVPHRVVEVERSRVELLQARHEGRAGTRLHIITVDGGEYWSGLARAEHVDEMIARSGIGKVVEP